VTDAYTHYGAMHTVLHERAFPHRVKNGVWMWSVFAEERKLDFNGFLVEIGPNRSLIVDPPCAGPEVLDGFTPLPQAEFIFLTNADHQRAAEDFKRRFQLPVYVHEADASLLSFPPDFTVQDGHEFPDGWRVIHLPNQKTPGESALYNAAQQTLILGDALIGSPYQQFSMLPAEKFQDRHAALASLRERLGDLAVKAVLVGDGDPVLLEAGSMLKDSLIDRSASTL
jgi:glyoxylase-like metal-dependent hydrolase (beta-lactamase superfamily II)